MKNISLKIVSSIIIIMILLHSTVVLAVDDRSELKNQQNETNKKIDEVKEELEDIKQEKSETVKQVEKLSTEIYQYQSQIDELEDKISKLDNKIKESKTTKIIRCKTSSNIRSRRNLIFRFSIIIRKYNRLDFKLLSCNRGCYK